MFSPEYQSQWRLYPYHIDLDSMVDMMMTLTKTHCWHGTASDLLAAIHSNMPDVLLPPDADQLVSLLSMVNVSLQELIEIGLGFQTQDGQQIVTLHRVPNSCWGMALDEPAVCSLESPSTRE